MRKRFVLVAMMALAFVGNVVAGEQEVPATLDGVEIVNSDAMLALMESGAGLIIDARKPDDFANGSIPGAINCQVSSGKADLGDAEVDATAKTFEECEGLKGADKGKQTAVFCNGITCWRSPKGALSLKKMGFSKVLWYRDGANDWKEKGLPME